MFKAVSDRKGDGSGSSFPAIGIEPAWLQEKLQIAQALENSDNSETEG